MYARGACDPPTTARSHHRNRCPETPAPHAWGHTCRPLRQVLDQQRFLFDHYLGTTIVHMTQLVGIKSVQSNPVVHSITLASIQKAASGSRT